ncbi:MAG: hypothetical protein JXO44_07615 [Clostridia bacterium]|nr:hypothetical protein [Clostridia bacterium]
MNKRLISLHWLLLFLSGLLLYFLQQSTSIYDMGKNTAIVIVTFVFTLLVQLLFIIKNAHDWHYHTSITLLSLMLAYKLFQLPLVSLWATYAVVCLFGLQLYLLHTECYKGWGIWTYAFVTFIAIPIYTVSMIFINKPVVTVAFDNDLSLINCINPLYTGVGYIVSVMGSKNYMGSFPLVILLVITLMLATPLLLQKTRSRKDVIHEEISK